jgi:tetratricopeptide (TPR) repeat protein
VLARVQPSSGAPGLVEIVERPVALRQGIGIAHEPVTTSSPKAQLYYDQGLAYLHSFVWIEAARSFNEALRLDPRLAMAQLGLSYALGELELSDRARQASRRAQELSGAASARERFRIELRALQLTAVDRPGDAAAMAAYRAQVAQVRERFDSDVELLLLVGHAQEPAQDAPGMNGGSGSLAYYRRALELAPDYFAAHHYLAHAYENLGQAANALPHARRFAQLAPAVPHAHHMYGHVLRQVDRMRDAVVEFKKADELHISFATAEHIPLALDWHYRHNLDLLGTSYQYLGQMARAEEVLRRSFEMPPAGHLGHEQDINTRAWPLFLLGRRRPDEALAAAGELQRLPSPLLQALGHALTSRILVATKRLDGAAAEGNLALRAMRAIGPEGGMLLPDFQLAQGEYLLRTGEADKGRAMLQDATKKLRAERGPDMWVATLFQLEAVASTARELGEWTLAAQTAELMRLHDAAYAGTQYALGLAAEHRGDATAARAALMRAIGQWKDAETDLPELQDARARIAARPPGDRPR